MDIGADSYRRFLEGDDMGLEEIIAAYKESLALYLVGFCGDFAEAEDLMEDVFVKLVVDRPTFRGKSSFKTWLFAIAGNIARDHLRRKRKFGFLPIEDFCELPAEEEDLLSEYYKDEERAAVRRCLSLIAPDYRQALYLSYFEEFGNAEIAHIMKKTPKQVENLLYRAKKSLGNKLTEEGYQYEKQQ